MKNKTNRVFKGLLFGTALTVSAGCAFNSFDTTDSGGPQELEGNQSNMETTTARDDKGKLKIKDLGNGSFTVEKEDTGEGKFVIPFQTVTPFAK